jgi:hypothetical protein
MISISTAEKSARLTQLIAKIKEVPNLRQRWDQLQSGPQRTNSSAMEVDF